jgi:HAE1 family hydrophobic/amphiphilic exporter-1
VLLAARRRDRPIVMTAITTIGGLIPPAFAPTANWGLSYTSFSLALVGGMTTATAPTLLVIPVFCTLFDDLVARAAQAWSGGWRRAAGARSIPRHDSA